MSELPEKLTNCPIIETDLEIRFTSKLPDDAIFGVIYQSLLSEFSSFQPKQQGIMQLPPELRKSDPNLRFKPTYQLENDNLSIGIGPRSIIFSNRQPYKGWISFKEFVLSALELILNNNVLDNINWVSIRYINLFNQSLFDATKINLEIGGKTPQKTDVTTLHAEFPENDNVVIVYQLNNNVQVSINNQPPKNASMIDLDIYKICDYTNKEFGENMSALLDDLHVREKKNFFQMLKDDFLTLLQPIYKGDSK